MIKKCVVGYESIEFSAISDKLASWVRDHNVLQYNIVVVPNASVFHSKFYISAIVEYEVKEGG